MGKWCDCCFDAVGAQPLTGEAQTILMDVRTAFLAATTLPVTPEALAEADRILLATVGRVLATGESTIPVLFLTDAATRIGKIASHMATHDGDHAIGPERITAAHRQASARIDRVVHWLERRAA